MFHCHRPAQYCPKMAGTSGLESSHRPNEYATLPCPSWPVSPRYTCTPPNPARRCKPLEPSRSSRWHRGVPGDTRYFGRLSRDTGQPTRRQVTLIEREQIAEHAAALRLPFITPAQSGPTSRPRASTSFRCSGRDQIGGAVLLLYAPRDPCAKMDAICQGLRAVMMKAGRASSPKCSRSGKSAWAMRS